MSRHERARLVLTLLIGVIAGMLLDRHRPHQTLPQAPVQAPVMETAPTGTEMPERVIADGEQLAAGLEAARNFLAGLLPGAIDVFEDAEVPDYSSERVMYDQQRLMDAALDALKPHTPGKTDLYLIAFAGDGDENVFRNEVEYVESLFRTRFASDGRVLVLENNPHTVATRPLATWSNLEQGFDQLIERKIIDPDEDILVLFLTSHGDEDHSLYVGMGDLPLDWISAEDLAATWNARPYRWRVNIISACYSGGFVEPLKNATSMVITAARADRTSFGCGSDSDITYFGKAFLVEGLNQVDSFRGAFDIAKRLVGEWEDRDEQDHSEPQIASSALIEAKLAEWRRGIQLGPVLPFTPASIPAAQIKEESTEITSASGARSSAQH